jgi:hypothetical protein
MPPDQHPAQRYVEALQEWTQETDPGQRAHLLDTQADALEKLWHRMADGLRRVAAQRARGPIFRSLISAHRTHNEAVTALAMHVFGALVIELRDGRVRIDPARTWQEIDNYLLGVARHQLRVANRKEVGGPRASRNPGSANLGSSGDAKSAMWTQEHRSTAGVWEHTESGERLVDPPDTRYEEFEERIVNALVFPAAWEIVKGVVQDELSAVDRKIIGLRWLSDPPLTSKQIAQQLGGGWTDTAVRQRLTRAMRRIQATLREKGWDVGH